MIKDNGMSTLTKTFSSKEWDDFFNALSETVHCNLSVFSEEGSLLYRSKEHPVCTFVREAQLKELQCPETCMEMTLRSSTPEEPVLYKCRAGLTFFSFLVERADEKACIMGTVGFASYEDLLDFLKLAKTYDLPSLPFDIPMTFLGSDYIGTVARYVSLSVNRLLISFDEKSRIEEKFYRMTSLFDSSTFVTLSRNPELMRRYVLDTLEFILGPVSSTLMVLNRKTLTYASVYSIGRNRDDFANFYLDAQSPLVDEMFQLRSYIYSQNLKAPVPEGVLQTMESFYFFPIFAEGQIEKIIGIFDQRLTREDVKIMNAFTDYLHLNFENRRYLEYMNKMKKADERFAYFLDFSSSIASVLSKDRLFHTLVNKSLQLLNAEQGSLMILDNDTSELVVEAKKSADETVQERMRLKKEDSIAGIVIDTGESLLVNDIERDPRFRRENRYRYKTKSFMSILLKIDDRVKGVLNISDKSKGDAFTEDDLKMLQSFVNNAAIAIERSLLYKHAEELKQLSITDPLTGIYNRRYLNQRLSEEITRYNRYKHSFSFMMLDLDKFKEYNDTYGHISGDRLIKALATIMEKSLRNVDIAARFGGDEFVAIFPQTTKEDAIHITNRLKEKIDKAFLQEGFEMQLTISMGLTTFPDDATSVGELLEKTDQALYLAKKGGGDKVVYL